MSPDNPWTRHDPWGPYRDDAVGGVDRRTWTLACALAKHAHGLNAFPQPADVALARALLETFASL